MDYAPDLTPIIGPLPPAQANELSPESLQMNPFFLPFDNAALFGAGGSTEAWMSVVWHQLLADAIPALSNPAGSSPIESWNNESAGRNVNMYTLRTTRDSGNRGGTSFSEHSAIKALPLGQTKRIFETVVEKGALNEMD